MQPNFLTYDMVYYFRTHGTADHKPQRLQRTLDYAIIPGIKTKVFATLAILRVNAIR